MTVGESLPENLSWSGAEVWALVLLEGIEVVLPGAFSLANLGENLEAVVGWELFQNPFDAATEFRQLVRMEFDQELRFAVFDQAFRSQQDELFGTIDIDFDNGRGDGIPLGVPVQSDPFPTVIPIADKGLIHSPRFLSLVPPGVFEHKGVQFPIGFEGVDLDLGLKSGDQGGEKSEAGPGLEDDIVRAEISAEPFAQADFMTLDPAQALIPQPAPRMRLQIEEDPFERLDTIGLAVLEVIELLSMRLGQELNE